MPSDDPKSVAFLALTRSRDRFRSALATTIEEVRACLDTRETSEEEHTANEQAALGGFAFGRVDPARFALLVDQTLTIDASDAARIESALQTLRQLAERLDALCVLRVGERDSLRDTVATRLAEIGRAFGAAHLVAAVRAKTFDESAHRGLLDAFPFARWSAAERALAPPLVVEVSGAGCHAAGLAEFLDGELKIVLLLDGPSSPAPLARLITPRTYVLQTSSAEALGRVDGVGGPAVAALVPAGAAEFCHDPAGGASPAERLLLAFVPDDAPRAALGGLSPKQQAEELALLRSFTAVPSAPISEGGAAAESGSDPAGQLATWLLTQAHLEDPS